MSKDINTKVKKIVADHLGVEEEKVTDEASFIDDLGADSLDTVITRYPNIDEDLFSKKNPKSQIMCRIPFNIW